MLLSALSEADFNEFYYQTHQPGVEYSTEYKNSSSTIDFNLLAQSEDAAFWATKQVVEGEKQKKKIIITNSVFRRKNNEVTEKHYQFILDLLQKGFEVNVLTKDNVLKPVTLKSWRLDVPEFKKIFENAVLGTKAEVINRLALAGENLDQCKILDHFTTESLVAAAENQSWNYGISLTMDAWENEKERAALLQDVDCNEVSHITLKDDIRTRTFDLEDIKSILAKFKKVTSLTILYLRTPLDLSSLNQLKKIFIFEAETSVVPRLPKGIEYFEHFRCDFAAELVETKDNPLLTLPHLEAVHLYQREISSTSLLSLPAHLRALILNYSTQKSESSQCEFVLPENLKNLQSIELVNLEKIRSIDLSQQHELTEITLKGCSEIESIKLPRGIKKLTLDNLSKMDLTQYLDLEELTISDLHEFPLLPPNIKKLTMHFFGKSVKILPTLRHYTKLEYIHIDGEFINELGELPEKLSYFRLRSIVDLKIPSFAHTNLKYLLLISCKLNNQTLQLPLTLENLVLRYCGNVVLPSNLEEFTQLRELSLEGTSIPQATSLLEKLPTIIQHLGLDYWSDESIPSLKKYCYLRSLSAVRSKIHLAPELPDSIAWVNFKGCTELANLSNLSHRPLLYSVNLDDCYNLKIFPHFSSSLKSLKCEDRYREELHQRIEKKETQEEKQSNGKFSFFSKGIQKKDKEEKPRVIYKKDDHDDHMAFSVPRDLKTTYAIYQEKMGQLVKAKPRLFRHHVKSAVGLKNFKISLTSKESKEMKDSLSGEIQYAECFYKNNVALNSDQYLVDFNVGLTNEWEPIPQISSSDRIIKMIKSDKLMLRYDRESQCYEVKSANSYAATVRLQYILQTDKPQKDELASTYISKEAIETLNRFFDEKQLGASRSFENFKREINKIKSRSLPERMNFCKTTLREYCKNFKDLEIIPKENEDIFFSVLLQQRGVCHHRSTVFTILCQYLGVPARHVRNEVHEFAEMYDGNSWKSFDFGGGAANTQHAEQKLVLKDTLEKIKPYERWLPYFSPEKKSIKPVKTMDELVTLLFHQSPVRLILKDTSEARALHAEIAKRHSNTFYIESAEDMDRYTKFLKKFIKTDGVLVINWENFTPKQKARYKSMLDKRPTFKGDAISPSLKIINLSTAGSRDVEVLSSRAKKISWPQDVPLPKLEPYFQIKSQEDLKDEKFIDLFGKDEDWYKILVGDYFINDNDFVLKPGKLLEAIKNNDKKIYLMDAPTQSRSFQAFIHRLKSERKIYVGEEVYEVPADFEIHCIKPFQQLNRPDNLNIVSGASFIETKSPPDIFYLNSETLGSLLKRNVILDKKLKTEAGWLALEEKSMQRRIIIQNGPLTSGELRQFYSMMQEYPGKVDFVDLSRVESKEMKALSTLDKFETKVLNGCFIETHDPSFLADQLKSEGDVIVHVNSKTSTAELIEYVDYKKKTKDYIHDIKQVSQALIEGKNVILAGTISHELYKALEPLMGEPPQLTLLNSSRPQRVLGRLTMLTKPVQYATSVISYANKKYNVSSEVLWQSYYTSLKKELGSAFNEEHFRRIRQFYELAGHIKHGQVGTPSMLHLNFTRIKHFMQYQQDAKHETMDNPIKSLFMHDYTKNKTNYAYLNVQAKKLFSQKEEKPGYRKEKLAAYPEDEQHLWQRLNCLNAAALRKVIPEGCTDEKTIAAHLKTWLSQNPLAILPPQKDPQAKLLKRVTATLAKHHAVVLKGPPGSGKTYLALEYAKNKGVKTFWGEKSIADWLNHTPPEGKEAVLVIDEANLSQPGTWDALMQNPKRTAQHKIIFTCNPEDYPGRSYHAVLQDIPTWYVKSWTNEGLFNHILLPMCRKAKGFDEKAHSTTLKQLLAAYHLAGQLMSKDTLSIRDLQQLTFRWLKAIEHSKDANLSAYKAAWFEWAESFMDAQKSARFKIDLTKLFGLKLELKPEPVQLGSEYYLSHSRRMLLTQIAEDMQLSAEATSTSADTAPLAKSGLLIEGASGIGKSTLLEKFLKSKQITHLEVDDLLGLRSSESKSLDSTREIKSKNNIKDFSNRYIHFTVTGDLAKDEAILLAAFNSGCKVILDELNLDPALETFLNDLLTGRTPDGKLPAHPGFFLLASQNGAGFEGINILSKALMNRLHVIYAKEDSKNDLVAMTEQALSGSLKNEWENIVEAYSVQKAQNPGEVNSRTFFDGIDQIKQLVEPSSSKNKQAISSSYVGLDSLDTTDKKPTTESSSSRVSAPSSRGSSHSGY